MSDDIKAFDRWLATSGQETSMVRDLCAAFAAGRGEVRLDLRQAIRERDEARRVATYIAEHVYEHTPAATVCRVCGDVDGRHDSTCCVPTAEGWARD